MSNQKALEAAVLADVDDDAALQIYADWLQEHGDPRGALGLAQRQHLPKQEAAIFEEFGIKLLGGKLAKLYPHGLNWTTWRFGFLDEVSITFAKKKRTSPYDVLAAVLESPSAVFLRRLELAHVPAAQHDQVVATLLAAKSRPPLRDLGLDETHSDEILEAFPGLKGKRGGREIERVHASDGPLSNLAFDRYKDVDDWAASCATRVVGALAKASFALPILEPGGTPNRAAIAHAVERVTAGDLGIPYSEPRQRAAAKHLIFWLEQIGDPVPKELKSVALGSNKKKK